MGGVSGAIRRRAADRDADGDGQPVTQLDTDDGSDGHATTLCNAQPGAFWADNGTYALSGHDDAKRVALTDFVAGSNPIDLKTTF